MKEVFVDSFFWLATVNPRDPHHQRACQYPRPPRLVTTRAVQIEVMDALSSPKLRRAGTLFWQQTNNDPDLHVVGVDEHLLFRAANLYESRPDKAWSLTDCISFMVMQERGVEDALTGDHHFEQAGFRALLLMRQP